MRFLSGLAFVLLIGIGPTFLSGCSPDESSTGPCCKVCSTGKPCGDSCIAKDKTCNKGSGCACGG